MKSFTSLVAAFGLVAMGQAAYYGNTTTTALAGTGHPVAPPAGTAYTLPPAGTGSPSLPPVGTGRPSPPFPTTVVVALADNSPVGTPTAPSTVPAIPAVSANAGTQFGLSYGVVVVGGLALLL